MPVAKKPRLEATAKALKAGASGTGKPKPYVPKKKKQKSKPEPEHAQELTQEEREAKRREVAEFWRQKKLAEKGEKYGKGAKGQKGQKGQEPKPEPAPVLTQEEREAKRREVAEFWRQKKVAEKGEKGQEGQKGQEGKKGKKGQKELQEHKPETLVPTRAKNIWDEMNDKEKKEVITRQQEDKRLFRPQRKPDQVFDPQDKIILVGEGNFSFAKSLIFDHMCNYVFATSNDMESEAMEKYPDLKKTIEQIQKAGGRTHFVTNAMTMNRNTLFQGRAPWDRIIFNFPHTGGVSTDQNYQVRNNQRLLSEFFKSAKVLLSPTERAKTRKKGTRYVEEKGREPGTILVTLFEGEPYTLWNIRDLARDAGLICLRSWRFDKKMFPKYKHARTCGVILDKDGNPSETAWKGEDRPARTYEFGLRMQDFGPMANAALIRARQNAPKKRKRADSSSDESSEVSSIVSSDDDSDEDGDEGSEVGSEAGSDEADVEMANGTNGVNGTHEDEGSDEAEDADMANGANGVEADDESEEADGAASDSD